MFASRLADLRGEMRHQGVDAVIIPRADEHLGEYVAARARRLAWLTGFTGSAGLAAVTLDHAAVFSDGRYVQQLEAETDPAVWERRHMIEHPPAKWLAALGVKRIGYDPWLIAEEGLKPYTEAGLTMVALPRNPVDAIWPDQPAAPMGEAVPHRLDYAGRDAASKRQEIAAALRASGQDAAVISDPASIAWLYNIRGDDVDNTPVALGFSLIDSAGQCTLFMSAAKLPAETRAWLGNEVAVDEPAAMPRILVGLSGKRVRVDPVAQPAWFAQTLREAGAEVVSGMDPCMLPKAQKNLVEQSGARAAHLRDAAAVAKFLHWLDTLQGAPATEMSAAAQLVAFRAEAPEFRGESFPAISGSGEHAAVMHYRVSAESDRALHPNEIYLIDSGAQYQDGTTDITRTIWTGPQSPPELIRDRFTRVLKGHIAIATLVFPVGVCGAHIDGFARQALWQSGLDFDHGTGHGVGSYLAVHEGPVSIARAARLVPIAAGMVLSNEPGFYVPGSFGIRLENLVLVQEAVFPQALKPFLRFETLSWAPFDRRLINVGLLSPEERLWMDRYHATVWEKVSPLVSGAVREWLQHACAVLEG